MQLPDYELGEMVLRCFAPEMVESVVHNFEESILDN